MPRYNLVMRDRTYLKLMQIAAQRNVSLGKLINQVLEAFVNNYEQKEQNA